MTANKHFLRPVFNPNKQSLKRTYIEDLLNQEIDILMDTRRTFRKNVDKARYKNLITGSLRVRGLLKKSQLETW